MKISAVEQELLAPEIATFAGALHDPRARERYRELHTAVQEGEVDDDLVGHLGNVLEIGLQSGRLRKFYGADGEAALARIYRRTPAGAGPVEAAKEVSDALSGLRGQTINDIQIAALGPGSYSLSLDTDRCAITVRIDRTGVRVDSVALGI